LPLWELAPCILAQFTCERTNELVSLCEDHIQWVIVVSPMVFLNLDEFLRDHCVPPCDMDKRLSCLKYVAVEQTSFRFSIYKNS